MGTPLTTETIVFKADGVADMQQAYETIRAEQLKSQVQTKRLHAQLKDGTSFRTI